MNSKESSSMEELQILEQNLQGLMMQKQVVNLELNEVSNSLEEVKSTSGDVYRVLGQVMIKSTKEKVQKDLEEKLKILELRASSIDKQERLLMSKAEELKEEVKKSVSK